MLYIQSRNLFKITHTSYHITFQLNLCKTLYVAVSYQAPPCSLLN
ncbi:conserved protein of unknown function [Pseudomonas marincola]|uniref:Uncharacterized protein n=1 Tax=Pseudomonas marincola TaxID=437900 RepID=A0A653E990_9PSED|nr:conserved protein of unknown function [Pseudomonas marincola]